MITFTILMFIHNDATPMEKEEFDEQRQIFLKKDRERILKKLDNVLHILLRELGIGHAASNDIVNNRSESIIQLLNSPYSLLGTVPYFTLINAENIIKHLSLDISEEQKIEGILELTLLSNNHKKDFELL